MKESIFEGNHPDVNPCRVCQWKGTAQRVLQFLGSTQGVNNGMGGAEQALFPQNIAPDKSKPAFKEEEKENRFSQEQPQSTTPH